MAKKIVNNEQVNAAVGSYIEELDKSYFKETVLCFHYYFVFREFPSLHFLSNHLKYKKWTQIME